MVFYYVCSQNEAVVVSVANLVVSMVGRLNKEQGAFIPASWFNDKLEDFEIRVKIDDFEIVRKDIYGKVRFNKWLMVVKYP